MRKMKFQLKYPDSDGNKGKKKQKSQNKVGSGL